MGRAAFVPREDDEQRAVAEYLDRLGLLWFHVPNELGQSGNYRRASWLRSMGVKRGVPDIWILDPPPLVEAIGTVIELKRPDKRARATEEQMRWLEALRRRGYYAQVCHGVDEVIELITRLGYGRVRPKAMDRWKGAGA